MSCSAKSCVEKNRGLWHRRHTFVEASPSWLISSLTCWYTFRILWPHQKKYQFIIDSIQLFSKRLLFDKLLKSLKLALDIWTINIKDNVYCVLLKHRLLTVQCTTEIWLHHKMALLHLYTQHIIRGVCMYHYCKSSSSILELFSLYYIESLLIQKVHLTLTLICYLAYRSHFLLTPEKRTVPPGIEPGTPRSSHPDPLTTHAKPHLWCCPASVSIRII